MHRRHQSSSHKASPRASACTTADATSATIAWAVTSCRNFARSARVAVAGASTEFLDTPHQIARTVRRDHLRPRQRLPGQALRQPDGRRSLSGIAASGALIALPPWTTSHFRLGPMIAPHWSGNLVGGRPVRPGSDPRPGILIRARGRSSMVEPQSSKLITRVRFSSPAPHPEVPVFAYPPPRRHITIVI
jgi:hypothetical protein